VPSDTFLRHGRSLWWRPHYRGAKASAGQSGGGKRPASPDPIFGFDGVMKLHAYLAQQFQTHQSKLVRTGFINGLPGFVTLEADGELQTTTLDIEDGRITAIYVVRNPDKLRHLH
jgi:RNA polymerase sigma-70 factor, ECF subfamily